METTTIIETPEAIQRLKRDLVAAAATLSTNEARYLVDAYYAIQENRKTAGNQVRALAESKEPHTVILWLFDQNEILEKQIKRALDSWTDSIPAAVWAKGIVGIGPVISAGLAAHIDITRCPTAGRIWRLAGLDPTQEWLPKTKRPWNAALKTLCWKIGDPSLRQQPRRAPFDRRPDPQGRTQAALRHGHGPLRSEWILLWRFCAGQRTGRLLPGVSPDRRDSEPQRPNAALDSGLHRETARWLGERLLPRFGRAAVVPEPAPLADPKSDQQGRRPFVLMIGRNYRLGDHRALGFHHWESAAGQAILAAVEGAREKLERPV